MWSWLGKINRAFLASKEELEKTPEVPLIEEVKKKRRRVSKKAKKHFKKRKKNVNLY